jgi:hypothetical protein
MTIKEELQESKITKKKNHKKLEKLEKLEKVKRRKNKENQRKKEVEDNIIRKACNYISKLIHDLDLNKNKMLGNFYLYVHTLFMILIFFVFLFNNNIMQLCGVLFIITLDAFAVVVFHGCPLTLLERKYLNKSSLERYDTFKKANILYNCQHEYEKTIEVIVNSWIMIALKCLSLMFLNIFQLKLKNYNNIYV